MLQHILIFQLKLSSVLLALPFTAQQIYFEADSALLLFITVNRSSTIKHAGSRQACREPFSVAPSQTSIKR
jgi:hypothetical protein